MKKGVEQAEIWIFVPRGRTWEFWFEYLRYFVVRTCVHNQISRTPQSSYIAFLIFRKKNFFFKKFLLRMSITTDKKLVLAEKKFRRSVVS